MHLVIFIEITLQFGNLVMHFQVASLHNAVKL